MAKRSKRLWRTAMAATMVVVGLAWAPAAHADCGAPANAIVAENCLPGTSPLIWDIAGAGSDNIQGFATDISVDHGQTVHFKVKSDAAYRIDIYRVGWYQGNGARKVATLSGLAPSGQPGCAGSAADTGPIDCGNWSESAAWAVPPGATSGIYFAHLVQETGTLGESHVPFIVRDDEGRSDLLFQTSDTTWQAYNQYGGASLYTGSSAAGRAYKVSYNRPLTTRGTGPEDSVFNSEYPMVRWLERNGYDVSYFTGVDSDRFGAKLREHRAFLSVGHDEYWSGGQRANVEAARDAGVSLAFFSGNEVFWKTRWEDDHRTLVAYKDTHANASIDPTGTWTGTWRDPRFSPPADGGRPENALTGTLFTVNSGTAALEVPAEDGNLRFWRGTDMANQPAGAAATLTAGTVGYEWDEDVDNGYRPAGLVRLSSTTVGGVEKLLDYGSTYGSGTATHHLTLYRDTNGADPDALVFGAGTVQWAWGLDGTHDRGGGTPSPAMQQATKNLFADMSAQPATPQADLRPATCSTDTTAPSVSITSTGATIQGTAADSGGGRVGAVEVSVDGGSTWHPATGRENWQYTSPTSGTATPLARAVDDSGNLTGSEPSTSHACVGATLGGGAGSPALGGVLGGHGSGPVRIGVSIRTRTVRMSRKGTVTLRVACPSAGPDCRVHLRLRLKGRTIAARTLLVRHGKTRSFRLKLSRAARRTVLRKGVLRVTAVASVATRRTTGVSVRIRAPRGAARQR